MDKGNFDLSEIDQFVHFCVNLSIFAEFVHFCAICPDCRLIDGQPSGMHFADTNGPSTMRVEDLFALSVVPSSA